MSRPLQVYFEFDKGCIMNNKQTKDLFTLAENMLSSGFDKFVEGIDPVNMFKAYRMRIQKIEVWNFRNIEYGTVSFPNSKLEDISVGNPSLLGLYGQNGSGKTSVIMAISILKELLSGQPLSNKYESCIRTNCEKCSLSFELGQVFQPDEVENDQVAALSPISFRQKIYYSFDITRTEIDNENGETETTLHVINEVLSAKVENSISDSKQSKQKLFDARPEESDDKGRPFGNKARYTSIVGNNIDITNKLRKAKAIAYDRSTSFLFSKHTFSALEECCNQFCGKYQDEVQRNIEKLTELNKLLPLKILTSNDEDKDSLLNEFYKDLTEEEFEEKTELIVKKAMELWTIQKEAAQKNNIVTFYGILGALKIYGRDFLFTVDTTSTGLVSVNEQWPILLWSIDSKGCVESYRVFLNLDKPSSIPEERYDQMKVSLSAVSKVLSAVVPGVSLEIADLGKQIAKDGKTTMRIFEVMSCRENNTIPLRFESDGIRRLVSILSLLIAAYNQPFFTIAVDEIDAGIFEFLLGEILKVLSNSAKGQIIFTSHNLRPLEVLPPKYLCFTTTNAKKKFVRLQNRGNSNFRDGYFRNIILGTSEDSIYKPTDQYEIEMAFYEAGQK